MKHDTILYVLRRLALSQGFYGRLLDRMFQDREAGEEFLAHLEALNFRSDLDLILYLES